MNTRYLMLFGGAIGDSTIGIHLARVLAANAPGARLELVSIRNFLFVRELTAEIPFVEYRELPKEKLSSWLALIGLLSHRYSSVVFEPVAATLPLWWRIILWCARARGGTQVWYQMHAHERRVARGVTQLVYNCPRMNIFTDTPTHILKAWGIEARNRPMPSLPRKEPPKGYPYIVFHFFAGNIRRSIPVEHARELLIAARAKYPAHEFVITSSASERELAKKVSEGISNARIESRLSATEVLSLLAGADVVVGTASGIIFLAAQIGAPTVSLSSLADPCMLPTYAPNVTTIAARDECRCVGNKTGNCSVELPDGDVFRCLYYIKTEDIIAAMNAMLV